MTLKQVRTDIVAFGVGIFILVFIALVSVDPIIQDIFYIVSTISIFYALGQKILRDAKMIVIEEIRKEIRKIIHEEMKDIICSDESVKKICNEKSK